MKNFAEIASNMSFCMWISSSLASHVAVMCLLGGVGGITPQIFLKLQESWPKVDHATIEIATVYSVTFLYQ